MYTLINTCLYSLYCSSIHVSIVNLAIIFILYVGEKLCTKRIDEAWTDKSNLARTLFFIILLSYSMPMYTEFWPAAYRAVCQRGIQFLDSGRSRGRVRRQDMRTWFKPSETRNSVRAKKPVDNQPFHQTALYKLKAKISGHAEHALKATVYIW